jgi:hypothetical protein
MVPCALLGAHARICVVVAAGTPCGSNKEPLARVAAAAARSLAGARRGPAAVRGRGLRAGGGGDPDGGSIAPHMKHAV